MSKIEVPTLAQLRAFIKEKGLERWANYGVWGEPGSNTVRDYFMGNCHYASKALAEMMELPIRRVVTRGWYTQVDEVDPLGWTRNESDHIAHTWVQHGGKIIDPTWWAFHPKMDARIYVFEADDDRYHTKDPK